MAAEPVRSGDLVRQMTPGNLIVHWEIVIFHDSVNRAAFIEKLTQIRQTTDQLLVELQASEHDKFAAHLYQSRSC
jgi:hypothetical protein